VRLQFVLLQRVSALGQVLSPVLLFLLQRDLFATLPVILQYALLLHHVFQRHIRAVSTLYTRYMISSIHYFVRQWIRLYSISAGFPVFCYHGMGVGGCQSELFDKNSYDVGKAFAEFLVYFNGCLDCAFFLSFSAAFSATFLQSFL